LNPFCSEPQRDFLLQTADVPRLEAECDKIIDQLESTRDLSRTIVHVDLDAFFASVEELADPSLKGIAFGVVSSPAFVVSRSLVHERFLI